MSEEYHINGKICTYPDDMVFYEWSKRGLVVQSMAFFVPRMKIYIETGKNAGSFPLFL